MASSVTKIVAALDRLKLTSCAARPIQLIASNVVAVCLLFGCETSNYAPVVKSIPKDDAKLQHGRKLFVRRCIECHTLPPIWKYSREDWPQIVNDMSHRASLNPEERDAVIAYILAARASLR